MKANHAFFGSARLVFVYNGYGEVPDIVADDKPERKSESKDTPLPKFEQIYETKMSQEERAEYDRILKDYLDSSKILGDILRLLSKRRERILGTILERNTAYGTATKVRQIEKQSLHLSYSMGLGITANIDNYSADQLEDQSHQIEQVVEAKRKTMLQYKKGMQVKYKG